MKLLIIDLLATVLRHLVSVHCRDGRQIDTPMTEAELAAALDAQVKESGEDLQWRTSVLDLFKAGHLDSSSKGRGRLWAELGLGLEAEYTGTADQNMRLHRAVLDALAKRAIALSKPAK